MRCTLDDISEVDCHQEHVIIFASQAHATAVPPITSTPPRFPSLVSPGADEESDASSGGSVDSNVVADSEQFDGCHSESSGGFPRQG